MDYIYDIVLNFQDNYYEFYEWRSSDKIVNYKKVLVYEVSKKDYLSLKYNDVVIDKKIIFNQSKIFLVSNGIEVMGILLDNDGRVIKRSSLLFDEADEVIEEKDNLRNLVLKYKKNVKREHNLCGRLEKEKNDYVNKFLEDINVREKEYLLKYIYYDIFGVEGNDIDKIYSELVELKVEDIDKLYDSLRRVNFV